MNRNPKEKYARIEIRAKPKDKEKIQKLAGKCNLSVSEYMVKRALGYEPRAVPSDAFFEFYDRLCQLANRELSPEVENELLTLIDEIHSELLLPGREKNTGTPQSLLCGEKEHPQSCELLSPAAKAKDGV